MHLDIFEQPGKDYFFSNLLVNNWDDTNLFLAENVKKLEPLYIVLGDVMTNWIHSLSGQKVSLTQFLCNLIKTDFPVGLGRRGPSRSVPAHFVVKHV